MVEALVAAVVLTVAMLGTMAMQAFALQADRSARLQAQAVALAHELAQAMQADMHAAADSATGDAPYLASSLAIENPNYCLRVANAANGCASTTDIARAEMTDWLTRVADELPGARVRVCFDTAPYDANGLAQWDCTADAGSNHVAYIKMGWTDSSRAGATWGGWVGGRSSTTGTSNRCRDAVPTGRAVMGGSSRIRGQSSWPFPDVAGGGRIPQASRAVIHVGAGAASSDALVEHPARGARWTRLA